MAGLNRRFSNFKGVVAILLMLATSQVLASVTKDSLEYYCSVNISKGRTLLLDKFMENDMESVKEAKDYLIKKSEDENCVSIYPDENVLILYNTKEYEKLPNSIKLLENNNKAEYIKFLKIDSIETIKYPLPDVLEKKLRLKSGENAEDIKKQIHNSNLNAKTKDFLVLYFDYFMGESRDSLNALSDDFLEKYPNSEYEDFIRKNIRKKYVKGNWGIGGEFFLGYDILTDELGGKYDNPIIFGLNFETYYKRLELYLRTSGGFNNTSEKFNYIKGGREETQKAVSLVGFHQASLGFAIFNGRFFNDWFKLSPFVGIGAMSIGAIEEFLRRIPEVRNMDLDYTMTYLAGANLDMRLSYHNLYYPFFRIRYEYVMPQFSKKYAGFSGNMHSIYFGIGFSVRGVREY